MNGLSFLAPAGLLALVGVPLILYFYMRHTTPTQYQVPTLKFWQAAAFQNPERSRLRIPPLSILLLLQLLIALAIGLALAQPAVSETWAGLSQPADSRHLVIVIDGSTSMAASVELGSVFRFERARSEALEAISDLRDRDVVTVLLVGSRLQTFSGSDPLEIDNVRTRLASVPLPGGRADLDGALRLVDDLNIPDLREDVLVLSDGGSPIAPETAAQIDGSVRFVQVGRLSEPNVAIIDIAPRSDVPDPSSTALIVKVANYTEESIVAPILAAADDLEFFSEEISIEPESTVDVVIDAIPAGSTDIVVEVYSNDVQFIDNQARIRSRDDNRFSLDILLVSDLLSPVRKALASISGATIHTVTSLQSTQLGMQPSQFDLVVFDGALPAEGGFSNTPVLIVDPPRDDRFPASGAMTEPVVTHVRTSDPLLNGVELTGVTFGETAIHELSASEFAIIEAQSGPLLYRRSIPESDLPMIVIPFDIAESNLPNRIAFPILMANIVRELSPEPLPATVPLGDPVRFSPHAQTQSVVVTDPAGDSVELDVPSQPSDPPNASDDASDNLSAAPSFVSDLVYTATGKAGEYEVREIDDSGSQSGTGSFVVNAGHPEESNLQHLGGLPSTFATETGSGGSGVDSVLRDAWPLLAAAALVLAGIEWLLSSRAGRRRGPRMNQDGGETLR